MTFIYKLDPSRLNMYLQTKKMKIFVLRLLKVIVLQTDIHDRCHQKDYRAASWLGKIQVRTLIRTLLNLMSGWQVKLCGPLVTHGPYLSALEMLHNNLKYYTKSRLLYFTLLY